MVNLEEKQRAASLLDIYGGLLTERQRDFMDLYFIEDLSYGEIAESENISRQAVHDTISHAKIALEKFEIHLGLAGRQVDLPANPNSSDIDIEPLKKEIADLSRYANDNDLLYDTDKLRRKVKRLRELVGMD